MYSLLNIWRLCMESKNIAGLVRMKNQPHFSAIGISFLVLHSLSV